MQRARPGISRGKAWVIGEKHCVEPRDSESSLKSRAASRFLTGLTSLLVPVSWLIFTKDSQPFCRLSCFSAPRCCLKGGHPLPHPIPPPPHTGSIWEGGWRATCVQSSNKFTTKSMRDHRGESTSEKKEKNHPYGEKTLNIFCRGYNALHVKRANQNQPDESSPLHKETNNSLNAQGHVGPSPN